MLQPTGIKDTFGFRYYDHYGNRQSVTLRQGDQGGITKVNTDGTQTELAELKGVKTCDAPIPCENYNNLKPLGTSSSTVGWNTLFHESFDVMKDYYAGNITADDVSEYIRSLCSFGSLEKSQISDSLSTIYEHMSRANTRNAVNQNMQEAERFFSETGLRKDTGDYYGNHKGIIYYNSDYYFACESMQTVIRNTLDEMAQKYGVDKPNYERLNEGRTFIDGGITYNGVWNQETLQGNRYHTMDDIKYIACDFVPDKSFVYCEANIRMDAESNNNGLLSIIKEYAYNKLLRTEEGKGHTLQIELERNSRNTTGHIEKRNALHRRVMNNIVCKQNNRILRYAVLLFTTTSILLNGCSEETSVVATEAQTEMVDIVPSIENPAASAAPSSYSSDAQNDLTSDAKMMEVHFIDVGEGDATLIKCADDAMLIDAGDASMGTTVRLYLKKQGVDRLKYLLLTHSDRDHIGGAASVVSNIDIDEIFMCRYAKTNDVYMNLLNEIDYKSMTWRTPNVGEKLTLGDAEITVVAPNREYDNPNDSSIAVLIRHGDDSFLFTGDAETPAEEDILANGLDISADVYKVGHHGSRTATSQAFLDAVSPSYAIVSCAAGNDYGHPHIETLEKLKNKGTLLYRTDVQGTIVAVSDGKGITFDKQPTDDWSEGSATDAESASTQVKQMAAATPEVEEKLPEEESSQENGGFVVYETDPNDAVTDRSLPITNEITYVVNTNTKKFHRPECDSVTDMKQKNRWDTTLSREELIEQGYEPCKRCKP